MDIIKIDTEFVTLSQAMKIANIASSGGEAKHFILQELVLVNNEICTQRGRKLYKDDIIEFDEIKYVIQS